MSGFKVGQTVILREPRRYGKERHTDTDVTIVRIGRKYIFISRWSREFPFFKDTGRSTSDNGGWIYTPERLAEEERRNEVVRRLREDHQIVRAGYGAFTHSTSTLEKILSILDEDKAQP